MFIIITGKNPPRKGMAGWVWIRKGTYLAGDDPGDIWPTACAIPLGDGWQTKITPLITGQVMTKVLDAAFRDVHIRARGKLSPGVFNQLTIIYQCGPDGIELNACATYLDKKGPRVREPIKVKAPRDAIAGYILGLTGRGKGG